MAAWLLYMAMNDGLEAFYRHTFQHVLGHWQIGAQRSEEHAWLITSVEKLLMHREVVAPLLLFGIVRERRGIGPLFLWAVAGLVMFLGQGKFFHYHFYSVLAPLAALSGIAVAGLIQSSIANSAALLRTRLLHALVLLLAVGIDFSNMKIWFNSVRITWSVVRDPSLERAWLAAHVVQRTGFSILDYVEVARFLEAERRESDTLLSWTFPPTLYSLTGFAPASRFVSNSPLIATFRWEGYDRQFDEELRARDPDFVVVGTRKNARYMVGTDQTSAELVSLHPRLEALVASMQLICSTPTLDVYSRRLPERGICPDISKNE